eukprot:CAMPEP_0184855350 /NCGR_PEP_ID=MMETSP0580-20130426/631_1 /TAXON_ID=1118495 /ORGANISM="Dactyliosolen fragilissimus" /LENGTH=416 /DNA_ID=CAMNT_0027349847 /DNA_START=143 /DNA_END=1394 /DNA_ORIENTATION=+
MRFLVLHYDNLFSVRDGKKTCPNRLVQFSASPKSELLSSDTNTLLIDDEQDFDVAGFVSVATPSSHSQILSLTMLKCDDSQQVYDMMIGRALDTFRRDYPSLLTEPPDFSIYHEDIEVVDPSGVKLHSLRDYKASFQLIHGIVKFFYCPEQSLLTFKLVYDCARKNIRVSWNVELTPKVIYGGVKNQLHVDGISVYEMDPVSGLVTQHRVEHLLINSEPVQAPQGIFQAIRQSALEGPDGIPVLNTDGGNFNLQFQRDMSNYLFRNPWNDNANRSILFASSDQSENDDPQFDKEAFESKNASRKKFGLPPLTPDEFVEIQSQVQAMDAMQRQKAASSSAAEMAKPKSKGNFLSKLGNAFESTCESNFDCERPEICCDFGFKKMCCRSGVGVFNGAPTQLQRIPVRVVADDGMNNKY